MSKRDVFELFHRYGRLAQISLKSAYGFVQYHTVDDAQAAMNVLQGAEVKGRKISKSCLCSPSCSQANNGQTLRCPRPRSQRRTETTLLSGETETEVGRSLIDTTDEMADGLEETTTALAGRHLPDAATTVEDRTLTATTATVVPTIRASESVRALRTLMYDMARILTGAEALVRMAAAARKLIISISHAATETTCPTCRSS